MQRKYLVVLMASVMLLLLTPGAWAQTATITGRVTDSTAAVIPGTKVTVTNEATGSQRVVESNEVGYYTVPLLSPGDYRITAEADGFKMVNRTGVILEVDQRAEINFVLEVGAITEQIEVSADAIQLNTVEASQGQVIENQRIVEMPLNGRNYNQLALLSAGTVQSTSGSRFGGFSSGGMRVTQNNFQLDGVDNNGVELAGAQRRSEMVQPSVDAIQEFKVQTNAYAAEYGRAMGSVVNVTTKSGTNELHGTGFYFIRNEAMDAQNYFTPANTKKPRFRRNQYGFSVGGPVYFGNKLDWRNKVFWFADAEWTDIRQTRTATSTIPTLSMRNGDFSELLGASNKTIIDPLTQAPFPGNIIPEDRFDPIGKTMIDLYPNPQTSGVAANFVNLSPQNEDVKKWDVRADVSVTDKDNVYWRYSWHDFVRPQALTLPAPAFGGGNDQLVEGNNTAVGWNHIWTPNLIMSIRGTWNFSLFKRDNVADAYALAEQLGVVSLNDAYGIPGGTRDIQGSMSLMSITGYANVGMGGFNPVDRDSQNRQIIGDLTWIKGKHTIKTGGSLIRSQNNIFNIRTEVGQYTFNNRFTKDGQADMLLGWASAYAWDTRLQVQLRSWLVGGYVQDDWKITPKLTLNLGARYEVVLPFLDTKDRMGIFDTWTDPANPRLIYAGAEGSDRFNRAMIATDKNNIMPRVGFAYKLNDKTVIRAGYGIFYGYLEPFGDAEFLIGNPPNAYGISLGSSATTPAVLLKDGPAAGATDLENAVGLTFVSYERTPDIGYGQQWNFNIQRELGQDWLWEVGYSGSKGTHLLMRFEDNFSPPGPGSLNDKRPYQSAAIPGTDIVTSPLGPVYGYKNNSNSNYHALVTRLEKRFSAGFTLLTSYTFSKNIGDVCGNSASGNTTGCGYQDTRYLNIERAVDNQDFPHRFVVSGIYDIPFGRGRRWGADSHAVVNGILGGWSLGSIFVASSGEPFSVTVSGNPANTGSRLIVNRPNVVGNPYDLDRTVKKDFNTSAFVPNNQYEIGNAGRNILRQRSTFNWDFSALKNFELHERLRLQFRFEAFNFTNTPAFGQPGATVGTGTFGQITSAGTPRNLQLGLKLIW